MINSFNSWEALTCIDEGNHEPMQKFLATSFVLWYNITVGGGLYEGYAILHISVQNKGNR